MTESEDNLKNLKKLKDAALSCVHCGQCRVANWPEKEILYVCPVYNTDITPKFEPFFARGKNILLKGLLWGDLDLSQELSEIIFQCSLCGACEDFCQDAHNENIDFANSRWMNLVEVFEALRADLVESGFALDAHIPMNKALVELLNPYGRNNEEKIDWIKELDFEIPDASKDPVDILYFVGCTAALTPKIRQTAISTAKILHKLGVNFGIMGEQEICCGSVALRTGDKKAFETVAEKNIELFNAKGFKQIITSCAGCYRTLKKDYDTRLKNIKISHFVEFLEDYLEENDIRMKKSKKVITYHDPCHIGRHVGLYDAPRRILNKIANLVEMKTIKNGAHCCGAGGGVKKGFPELSQEMATNRVKEAEATGAEILVSTCPFCYRNLSDAIESLNSNMKMMDLVELVLNQIE